MTSSHWADRFEASASAMDEAQVDPRVHPLLRKACIEAMLAVAKELREEARAEGDDS